ncbi:MAG: PaaI family thioesterase [Ruegeria sp.]
MASKHAITPDTAQSFLEENFAEWVLALNLSVIATERDHTVIRMPLAPHLARVGGIVSGQALAALADTTMVIAAISHSGEFKPYATTDLHTQFLRPGVGTAILCRAKIVRAGRSLFFARADMTEESSNKAVACATATFLSP